MSDESRAHLSLLFDGFEGFVALGVGFGGRWNGNGIYEFIKLRRGDLADDPAAHGLSGAAAEVAHDIEDEKKGR